MRVIIAEQDGQREVIDIASDRFYRPVLRPMVFAIDAAPEPFFERHEYRWSGFVTRDGTQVWTLNGTGLDREHRDGLFTITEPAQANVFVAEVALAMAKIDPEEMALQSAEGHILHYLDAQHLWKPRVVRDVSHDSRDGMIAYRVTSAALKDVS